MANNIKWIDINEKLLTGVSRLNKLTETDFSFLLQFIIEKKNPLRELQEAEEVLKLSGPDLNFIVQCLALIFKESQRVIIKPTLLQKQLTESLKFDSEKAEIFVKVWATETKQKFGDFENRLKLSNITWELTLQSASSNSSKEAEPGARIQLEVCKNDTEDEKDCIVLDNLNEENLVQIYNTLELIQKKIDSLNS